MLYLVAAALGMGAGLLAGGRLSRLTDIRFRKVWIVIAAFALQAMLQIMHRRGIGLFIETVPRLAVLAASYILLCIVFWHNRGFTGIIIIAAGFLMNAMAVLANGGYMPVDYDAAVEAGLGSYMQGGAVLPDGLHIVMTENSRVPFFGDMIHPPSFLSIAMQVISPGDMVIAAGIAVLCFELTKKDYKQIKDTKNTTKTRG